MRTKGMLFTLLFVCFTSVLATSQVYTINDLGPLQPTAINTWAQVAGNYNNQAYIWTFGRMRAIGTLHGGTLSNAAAINDLGIVAGLADGPGTVIFPDGDTTACSDLFQPFIWTQAGGMRGLPSPEASPLEYPNLCEPPFLSPVYGSHATGINRSGQLVGSNYDVASYKYGFFGTGASGWTLFVDDFQTAANGINNVGQVVGENGLEFLNQTTHAAIWVNGNMTDLGSLGGDATNWNYCSGANGNNDRNQVVGWSYPANVSTGFCSLLGLPVHAFLWNASTGMQDLGTLAGDSLSVAVKINFQGQVIGSSGNSMDFTGAPDYDVVEVIGRPFLWSARNGMQDLNTLIPANSGWVLNSAADINVWGQIVGQGTRNGQPHGYLLTPKNPF